MKVQMVKSEKVMKFFGDKNYINVFFQRGGDSLFLPASGRDKNSSPNSGLAISTYGNAKILKKSSKQCSTALFQHITTCPKNHSYFENTQRRETCRSLYFTASLIVDQGKR
jgi:hypothetical protein